MLITVEGKSLSLALEDAFRAAGLHVTNTSECLLSESARFSDLAAQILHLSACAFAELGCRRGFFIFHEDRNQRIGVMFLNLHPIAACHFRSSKITTTTMPDTAKSAIAVGTTNPNEPSIKYSNRGRERKAGCLQMFILITSAMNVKQPPLLYQNVSAAAC